MRPVIVVDANVMLGALMGRSLPLIAALAERATVVAPPAQLAETRTVLARKGYPDVDARMAAMLDIVEPLNPLSFATFEDAARARLEPRGQSDWPLLAAALALEGGIWSRDPDLFGTGVPLWFTRNIHLAGAPAQ